MSYDAWKLATPPEYDYQPECSACDDAGCPECCETLPITLDDLEELDAQMSQAEIEQLKTVERAARRLMREGLRLTPDGLIVRESRDNSDPHYQLCKALDAIEPLNAAPTSSIG